MYSNNYYQQIKPINSSNNNDRFFAGGFLGPFILGGITGGLLAPSFYPRPYPIYNTPIYRPYPSYPVPYTQNQYYYYN